MKPVILNSKEEVIFKDLVKEPRGYEYVERGDSFLEVRKDGETFRIEVWKKVPRKSKNRPNGFDPKALRDII